MSKQDNYTAEIETHQSPELIDKVFASETDAIKTDRSSFTIEKQDNSIKFKIVANDATALRATLNTITKILSTVEKIKEIK